jgi:hypothetical protein
LLPLRRIALLGFSGEYWIGNAWSTPKCGGSQSVGASARHSAFSEVLNEHAGQVDGSES